MKSTPARPVASGHERVLIVYYSQSGDVEQVLKALATPLRRPQFELVWEKLRPTIEYPWPWRSPRRFFDVMPETVMGLPPKIVSPTFDAEERFDLVILGYSVWYLSPSLPIQSFLRSSHASVLRDTRVITVSVSRKMWLQASESVKRTLADLGATHIDNVAVTHQGPPWATLVTTTRALLSGKRDRLFGIFPLPGVAETELSRVERLGAAIAERFDDIAPPASLLRGLGAVDVNERYVIPELLGRYCFQGWAWVLHRLGRHSRPLRWVGIWLFMFFLVGLILAALPLTVALTFLLRPVFRGSLGSYVVRLKEPSGA